MVLALPVPHQVVEDTSLTGWIGYRSGKDKRLVVVVQSLLLLPKIRVHLADVVQRDPLAFAVPHRPLQRQRLIEVVQRLLLLPKAPIHDADAAQGVRLALAVPHRPLQRQRLVVVAQRLPLHPKSRMELRAQMRRMMKDPKIEAFSREFFGQWLRYRDY